jgi:hypothetical protein
MELKSFTGARPFLKAPYNAFLITDIGMSAGRPEELQDAGEDDTFRKMRELIGIKHLSG